jgi:hypothetical protein
MYMYTESNHMNNFEKARLGLWTSLQKHLDVIYEAEKKFIGAVPIADVYPFSTDLLSVEKFEEYQFQRVKFRDILIDETIQLDNLVKALRLKSYQEDDKKQLFLLILGYIDIAESVFSLLATRQPKSMIKDLEFEDAISKFDRVKNFVRLNIKGINGLLVTNKVK